jgi:hypothetical protein
MLIGDPAVRFHRDLAARACVDRNFHYHYVTAREMCNLVLAAEAGWQGSVAEALDYRLLWNGGASTNQQPQAHAGALARMGNADRLTESTAVR